MTNDCDSLEFPAYLAISAILLTFENIQVFSPYAMQWDDHIWLIDMRAVTTYWQRQIVMKRMTAVRLLRSKLLEICPEGGTFICAGSRHPWRAILVLKLMQERSMHGIVLEYEAFGSRLYQQVSWSVWWQALADIGRHFSTQKIRGFAQEKFGQQCQRMQEILPRMGRNSLSQFKIIDGSNIRRRFGRYLEAVWAWTFSQEENQTSIEFPWRQQSASTKYSVSRCLDFPLSEWDYIAGLLIQDLDHLCSQAPDTEKFLVLGLEWRLELSDDTFLPLSIAFRHPHLLSKEMHQHPTALLQAKYAFDNHYRKKRKGVDSEMHAIVAWELIITEHLRVSYTDVSLFHDEHQDFERLEELENKLPVPLLAYQLNHDWLPEHSYEISAVKENMASCKIEMDQWLVSAYHRPPFIYHKPITYLHNCFGAGAWLFLEKSMNKWWQSNTHKVRHYYRVVHNDQQSLWVYRTEDGKYYIHGNYA
jgi:hypothetical protein